MVARSGTGKGAGERVEAAALYIVVFVCGTVLMAAEIAGSRVLAPYFGSAIFVWGSLIGIVMVALAFGYYVGGRVADVKPSFPLLCGIVAAAGLWLMVMPAFSNAACGAIEDAFKGPRAGPLLASICLFLVPGVLLGMVSPFAVRLSAREVSHIGNVAGRLYALSTVGSIVGTIGTAFVLIPEMGTRKLIFSLGVALLLTAAAGLAVVWREARKGLKSAAGIVIVGGLFGPLVARGLDKPGARLSRAWEVREGMEHELIEWSDSAYHQILVTRQAEYKDPETGRTRSRRVLRFNDRTQSAIYVDTVETDKETGRERLGVYESAVGYTDLLHLGLVFCPDAKKALFVGGGAGIAPTEFVRDYDIEVEVAEIDREVRDVARKYFFVDDRVKFLIGDGRRTLSRLEGGYDLIVLDAYSSGGHIPAHLTTKEFLKLCGSKLSPGGVVVSNVISALEGKRCEFFQSEYRTMYEAGFANVYTFPRFPTPEEARRRGRAVEDYWKDIAINIIIVATEYAVPTEDAKRLTKDEIRRKARELTEREEHPVKIRSFVHYASKYWELSASRDETLGRMTKGILLTDDYCPVDTMFCD